MTERPPDPEANPMQRYDDAFNSLAVVVPADHPEGLPDGYEPGRLTTQFIDEAKRSPHHVVRQAAHQMQETLSVVPIIREPWAWGGRDPFPRRAEPRMKGFLRAGLLHVRPGGSMRSPLPADGVPDSTSIMERFRRAPLTAGLLAASGLIAMGAVVALAAGHGDSKPEVTASADARQEVIAGILKDGKQLRRLRLCADELYAEAEMQTYLHESGAPTYAYPSVDQLRRAQSVADYEAVSCVLPMSETGIISRVVAGTTVRIVPSDISRFDVTSVCTDLNGSEPIPMTMAALQKLNDLRRDLIRRQRVVC